MPAKSVGRAVRSALLAGSLRVGLVGKSEAGAKRQAGILQGVGLAAQAGAFDSERLLVTFGPQKLHMKFKCLNGSVFS